VILLARLLLFALCSLISASAVYASQQDELGNLRKRIAAMQREMDKTSESKSEAADALRESERAISDSNRKLAELAEQQRAADKKFNELQQQERRLIGSMAEQQVLLGRLLYQQYLGGEQEYLKLLLSNHDPNQVSRDLQYYKYIARSRATWLASLHDNFAALNAVSTATREQRAELKSLRAEQSAQKKHWRKTACPTKGIGQNLAAVGASSDAKSTGCNTTRTASRSWSTG